MKVIFWGTRGSGAATGREYMDFGGNTSCVSAEWENGLIVFDAGTGIAGLGEELVRRGFSGEIHLFLSHFHLDHICGLPLFAPAFCPGVQMHVYGYTADKKGVEECVRQVLSPPYWPVAPECYGAQIFWHDVDLQKKDAGAVVRKQQGFLGGSLKAGNNKEGLEWEVKALKAAHPDGGLIYRLEAGGRSVVYGLDCELPECFQEIYADFAKEADLLIFDAAYTDQEYPKVKGFGHATWQQGVAMAKRTKAARTVLAHHRRERTDRELNALDQAVRSQGLQVCFGKEGMEIILQEVCSG